ncbi:uncharacterized protein LOC103508136 [Diaphorina citri]|uniref:Uncharacterized protein LOC103508136 n=1 Tax=Diaphorina citri TaxID=121845 RepID=A0A1S3CZC5_DIACI|nr:uncharacterized protein LOC103508136 [Diaphorina citri]
MDNSLKTVRTHLLTFITLLQVSNSFDLCLQLPDTLAHPTLNLADILDNRLSHAVLSRHKRYTYTEPASKLVDLFEKYLTAREGDDEVVELQHVVDGFVKECDYLSHKALNESIQKYADKNYLVHYNNTEHVYRYYRQRYQDYTESLYHKLIYIMPYLVKRHMRSVMVNVTSDFKMINIACMNRFQELDSKVNTHFLSYGELFRSILIESYNDIEKNFYRIYTTNPQITGGLV